MLLKPLRLVCCYPNYDKYINQFIEINDEKEGLFGVKKLKEMFPDDFYKEDK